jgi:hypothetical protein
MTVLELQGRVNYLYNNLCCLIRSCLGIKSTGDANKFLNQQGQFVAGGGGGGNTIYSGDGTISTTRTATVDQSLVFVYNNNYLSIGQGILNVYGATFDGMGFVAPENSFIGVFDIGGQEYILIGNYNYGLINMYPRNIVISNANQDNELFVNDQGVGIDGVLLALGNGYANGKVLTFDNSSGEAKAVWADPSLLIGGAVNNGVANKILYVDGDGNLTQNNSGDFVELTIQDKNLLHHNQVSRTTDWNNIQDGYSYATQWFGQRNYTTVPSITFTGSGQNDLTIVSDPNSYVGSSSTVYSITVNSGPFERVILSTPISGNMNVGDTLNGDHGNTGTVHAIIDATIIVVNGSNGFNYNAFFIDTNTGATFVPVYNAGYVYDLYDWTDGTTSQQVEIHSDANYQFTISNGIVLNVANTYVIHQPGDNWQFSFDVSYTRQLVLDGVNKIQLLGPIDDTSPSSLIFLESANPDPNQRQIQTISANLYLNDANGYAHCLLDNVNKFFDKRGPFAIKKTNGDYSFFRVDPDNRALWAGDYDSVNNYTIFYIDDNSQQFYFQMNGLFQIWNPDNTMSLFTVDNSTRYIKIGDSQTNSGAVTVSLTDNSVKFDGNLVYSNYNVSGGGVIPDGQQYILIDSSGGGSSYVLPTPIGTGHTITIKDATGNAGSNPIDLDGNGLLIDNVATYTIQRDYGFITITYSGNFNKWLIVSEKN